MDTPQLLPAYHVVATYLDGSSYKHTDTFPFDRGVYGDLDDDSAELIALFQLPVFAPNNTYGHVRIKDATGAVVAEFGQLVKPLRGIGRVADSTQGMPRPPRPLGPAAAKTEARRHTRELTSAEYNYLQRTVRVKECRDPDVQQQVVTDAILYFMNPPASCEPLAVEDGGRGISYYLTVKATNLFLDLKRRQNAVKRGAGVAVVSLQARAESVDCGADELGVLGVDADESALDATVLRETIIKVLADKPDKLRLFELHLEGLTPAEITTAMGWGEADASGTVDSSRARKALFDTVALLTRKLPGLAKLRLGKGQQWGVGESESRPTTRMSSLECEAAYLAMEGPISRKDAKRLGLAA